MAKMGKPLAKLTCDGPHEYLPERTQEWLIVLNTEGQILRKGSWNGHASKGEYSLMTGGRRVKAEIMATLTDNEKATAWLTEFLARGKYTVKANNMAKAVPADTPEFGSLREKIAWEKAERAARYSRFLQATKAA